MAAFLYVAVDAGGRERKGVLEGDTARHVRQLLREQALLPVSATEVVGEQKQAARMIKRITKNNTKTKTAK